MVKKILFGVLLFVVLAVLFHSYIIGTVVKPQIERQVSNILGVDVKMNVLSVRLWPGSAAVYGLKIKNPVGFSDELLLDLGSFSAVLNVPALIKEFSPSYVGPQTVVIENVKVKNLKFLFERIAGAGNVDSNVEKIIKNLNAHAKPADNQQAVKEQSPETAQKPFNLKIELKQFSYVDGKVTVRDAQTGSGFEYVIDKINVDFRNIYFPAKPASELIEDLNITAQLGKATPGTFSLKGKSNVMAGPNLDANLSIKDVGLSDFNAFMSDQPFQITDGKFDLQSEIKILNKQLLSRHKLKLTAMELAGRSGGSELLDLPLQTLLSSLSRLPALHVPFDVNGDLNNPQFNITRAVKSAVGVAVQRVLAGGLGDLNKVAKELTGVASQVSGQALGAAKGLTGVAGQVGGQTLGVAGQSTEKLAGDAQKLVRSLTGDTSQSLEGGIKKISGFFSKAKEN